MDHNDAPVYTLDVVSPLPVILPNLAPIFVENLDPLRIDMYNPKSSLNYSLPEIYDINNDNYSVSFENLPDFITY